MGRLRRQPKNKDIQELEQAIGSLRTNLRKVFGAVRPMPPPERLKQAELFGELAQMILDQSAGLPGEFGELFRELQLDLEVMQERKERFVELNDERL